MAHASETALFGGPSRPWKTHDWTSSDDRVRGGESVSTLTVDQQTGAATFSGHLDITALGGAGFASQRTVDDHPDFNLSGYDSLYLDIPESDGKKYTLVLKDTVLSKRPDGREQSTVSWEHDFHGDSGRQVVLRFADFKPTYRGKPKDDAEPLDWSAVKRVSIMIRSFFGQQEGDFNLVISSITAHAKDDDAASPSAAAAMARVDSCITESSIRKEAAAVGVEPQGGNRVTAFVAKTLCWRSRG
ncbi:complex I intermediate-associated protein 30-domain-containing protein [Bombardia bombarda]|uniref:Complex I intermediate-associated protein 30-domain-containing protein n=1 Tax=Bombardia bombarda TaxID=252184 RepID=A0AA39X862_9PEZI|nr:complex I intermediate-associated protein 30-domain-containing protein [Bombardia bombarda]